jgi:hypothetical protein
MALNENCLLYEGRKRNCPASQKGKTYRLINNSESLIRQYEVDPCLIPSGTQKKCDYLFLINKDISEYAYFVELKGTEVSEAIKQISNSIDFLRPSIQDHRIFARIVGKHLTPNIKSRRASLDEKLKRFGGDLKIVSREELIEDI